MLACLRPIYPAASPTEQKSPLEQESLAEDDVAIHAFTQRRLAEIGAAIARQNWSPAFQAWFKLYDEALEAAVDAKTQVQLIRLLENQDIQTIRDNWTIYSEHLLLCLARRGSGDAVFEFLCRLLAPKLNQKDLGWNRRLQQFWRAYCRARKADDEVFQPVLPAMTVNLFSLVVLAYHSDPSSRSTLRSFLETCATASVPVLPPDYHPKIGLNYITTAVPAVSPSAYDSTRSATLRQWLYQCDLFRIWYLSGEEGLDFSTQRWRDTGNAAAPELYWSILAEHFTQFRGDSAWWAVAWDDEAPHRWSVYWTPQSQVHGAPHRTAECTTVESDDEDEHDLAAATQHSVILKLPAVFTPRLVASISESLTFLGQQEKADEIWRFCRTRLDLEPTFIMWQSRLSSLSGRSQYEAADRVFREMHDIRGFAPSIESWNLLLKAYFKAGAVEAGLARLQDFLSLCETNAEYFSQESIIRPLNTALQALFRHRELAVGLDFLHTIIARDRLAIPPTIETINIVLHTFSKRKHIDLEVIGAMMRIGRRFRIRPNTQTLLCIALAYNTARIPNIVQTLLGDMEAWGVRPDMPLIADLSANSRHLASSTVTPSPWLLSSGLSNRCRLKTNPCRESRMYRARTSCRFGWR